LLSNPFSNIRHDQGHQQIPSNSNDSQGEESPEETFLLVRPQNMAIKKAKNLEWIDVVLAIG